MVDSIIIQKHIPEEKYNEVIEHLRSNFFADEPLNKAVKLCDHGEKHHDLEMHSLKTLEDNLSVMAIDSNTNRVSWNFRRVPIWKMYPSAWGDG